MNPKYLAIFIICVCIFSSHANAASGSTSIKEATASIYAALSNPEYCPRPLTIDPDMTFADHGCDVDACHNNFECLVKVDRCMNDVTKYNRALSARNERVRRCQKTFSHLEDRQQRNYSLQKGSTKTESAQTSTSTKQEKTAKQEESGIDTKQLLGTGKSIISCVARHESKQNLDKTCKKLLAISTVEADARLRSMPEFKRLSSEYVISCKGQYMTYFNAMCGAELSGRELTNEESQELQKAPAVSHFTNLGVRMSTISSAWRWGNQATLAENGFPYSPNGQPAPKNPREAAERGAINAPTSIRSKIC
jgi:hypothetical protein